MVRGPRQAQDQPRARGPLEPLLQAEIRALEILHDPIPDRRLPNKVLHNSPGRDHHHRAARRRGDQTRQVLFPKIKIRAALKLILDTVNKKDVSGERIDEFIKKDKKMTPEL